MKLCHLKRINPLVDFDRYNIMLGGIPNELYVQGGLSLDVGCYLGSFSLSMLEKGLNVIGLELEYMNARKARSRLKRYDSFNLVIADAQYLPFRDGCLNLIIAGEVIEHLPNPALLIRDAYSSLRKTGLFILSTPNSLSFESLVYYIYEPLRLLRTKRELEGRKGKDHISLFTYNSLRNLLTSLDFKIKKVGLKHGLGLCDRLSAFIGEISSPRSRETIYRKVNSSSLFSLLYRIEMKVASVLPKQVLAGWILFCVK